MEPKHPALAVLDAQREAWNAGDLEGYLARCAADIVYVTARGPVYGIDALRAGMQAAYPDAAAMGQLTLDVLHVDADAAEVRAVLRWAIARAGPATGGYALVVLARREGRWVMTHDATLS